MRPEKAARISSYLARNSARISIMNREREEIADYYEKNKYAEYAFSEEAERIAKRRAQMDAHRQPQRKRKNSLFGNGKGMPNILGFGFIVIIMVMIIMIMK